LPIRRPTGVVLTGAALGLVLLVPIPASAAPPTPAAPLTPTSAPAASSDVIVILRDQHAVSTRARSAFERRTSQIRTDQSAVVDRAEELGARKIHRFTSVNAMAMTVDAAGAASLAADPRVASVVPDRQLTLPRHDRSAAEAAGRAASAATARGCTSNPAAPLHEPEGLQTMRAESVHGNGGSHAITRGEGVTVGWIADGLDPENPDFQRNGQSIFSDYQDFTNDGPGAPTSGAEAFGDASSIAAQGNVSYDLADYVNEEQALPAGCTITVTGIAPGANLVGLKVFGQSTAPTSRFVQAIDYAVSTAHVDVLNESFGANPFPDTQDDPISLANGAATRAGVSVVVSTGDAGGTSTTGSPASSKDVISVGATTTFRGYQQTQYGYIDVPGVKGYASDNISQISSGGFAQNQKVPDVVAPGDLGWAVCSPNQALFVDCADNTDAAGPSGIQLFGGTSQSAPLTAGAAALVISAYRTGHPGAPDPSPSLVKRLLTSTARDLRHPAQLQGAGEVDTIAAVKAALSVPTEGATAIPRTNTGTSLVADRSQLDLSGKAGTSVKASFRLLNASRYTQKVHASVRALTKTVTSGTGSVAFDGQALPKVLSAFGADRAYASRTISVRKGVDRLDASIAFQGGDYAVSAVLVDPRGIYQAYSIPQGAGNFGHVDVRNPVAGTWKLFMVANPAFSGKVAFSYQQRAFAKLASAKVSQASVHGGSSVVVSASLPLPKNPGDLAASIQVRGTNAGALSMPVSLRASVLPKGTKTSTFTGVITGGNGRGGAPAQSNSYDILVPVGQPSLSVGIKLRGQTEPLEVLEGTLVSPQGQAVAVQSNVVIDADGNATLVPGVQLFARQPAAGHWTLVLQATNPVEGITTAQPFTGSVSLVPAPVSSSPALPTSAKTVLAAGEPVTVKVKVKNTGVVARTFFADGRLNRKGTYALASQTPGDDQQALDLLDFGAAQWLVPTRTDTVTIRATSDQPISLDAGFFYGDPEVYGRPDGTNGATATFFNRKVAQGPWYAQAAPVGPFTTTPAEQGTVAYSASVRTHLFDPAVTSSTGDYWQTALIPAAGIPADQAAAKTATPTAGRPQPASRATWSLGQRSTAAAAPSAVAETGPLTLAPGKTGTITVQITPRAADKGTTVSGTLDIDTFDPYFGTGDEVRALSYTYKVG